MLDAVDQVRRAERMNGGKRCPRCHRDIGVAPTLFLYLNKLECPRCRLPIRYEDSLKFILTKVLLILVVAAGILIFSSQLPAGLRFLWWSVLFVVCIGLEASAGVFIRQYGTLRPRH